MCQLSQFVVTLIIYMTHLLTGVTSHIYTILLTEYMEVITTVALHKICIPEAIYVLISYIGMSFPDDGE